jgi:MoaA/NifB/PqqE/SkfB family radical SAM enzyme
MLFNNLRAPYHVNWNISNICDFSCRHCYSRALPSQGELTLPQKLKVAENIVASHVFSVNLGGGEPLLSSDTRPVVEYLASAHVIVSLTTNGWYVKDTLAQDLKRIGLRKCFVSLDDIREEYHDSFRRRTGSFRAALQAMQSFVASGLQTMVSVVLTRTNYPCIQDIISLAQELGCSGVELKRLRLCGSAAELCEMELSAAQERVLYDDVRRWRQAHAVEIALVYDARPYEDIDAGCPCGRTSLAILSDGSMAPCVYNPVSIGNALENRISDIWTRSPVLLNLRNHYCCAGMKI